MSSHFIPLKHLAAAQAKKSKHACLTESHIWITKIKLAPASSVPTQPAKAKFLKNVLVLQDGASVGETSMQDAMNKNKSITKHGLFVDVKCMMKMTDTVSQNKQKQLNLSSCKAAAGHELASKPLSTGANMRDTDGSGSNTD